MSATTFHEVDMLRATTAALLCLAVAACGDGDSNGNAIQANQSAAGNAADSAKAPAKASLLDTLTASQAQSTFANAVNAAGLGDTLSGAQPYTLFAPSNAAFEKLPAGTMDSLLAPDGKGALTNLLVNHIVPGVVTAEDIERAIEQGKGKARLAAMGGSTLTFSRADNGIVVAGGDGGQGRIDGAGQTASNGVLHTIDTVLIPKG
jgi:uncharacterized surface protein with fasciclin (FAS1) repeats